MKQNSFRQWIICVIICPVFFCAGLPLSFCFCADCPCTDCPCANSLDFCFENHDCVISTLNLLHCCCMHQGTQCPCGNFQQNTVTLPNKVSSTKKLNNSSSWKMGVVSVPPFGQNDALGLASFPDARRSWLWLNVPLHVMLCVFLN